MFKSIKWLVIAIFMLAEPVVAATTELWYQSSSSSEVTRGRVVNIQEGDLFFFEAQGGPDYISFLVHNFFEPIETRGKLMSHSLMFTPKWNDNVPGPFAVGTEYANTSDLAGPSVSVRNSLFASYNAEQTFGEFSLFEYEYTVSGVTALSIDFTQYELGDPDKWAIGSIRYNSDLPINIPEPTVAIMVMCGVVGVICRRSRSHS